MTHRAAGITGAVFLGIAILGFLYPVNSKGYTVFEVNDICTSGVGQLAQILGGQSEVCREYKYATYGVIGIGFIGIILVIIGAVVPSKSKENALTCPYCNYVPSSETNLLKHKANNHLDKYPYKCEHCGFRGITEEVLWNHYNDKHPDKKKW
ncbi:MAG: hypothetical protein WD154_00970 [Nitrosopumilaceae archaeon]